MKAKRFFSAILGFVFLCAVVLSAVSCTKISAADLMVDISAVHAEGREIDEAFTAAELAFSIEIFKRTAGEGNTLVSPLSVLLALAIVANGAEGETLAEMESTLGLPIEELNKYLYTYISSLPEEEKCKLTVANSVWLREEGINVNKPFLEVMAGYYGAEAYSAPFDSSTVRDINSWVSKNTDGMIDEVLENIPPHTLFYIVNTLLFDAQWQTVYEKTNISNGKFTTADGEERTVKYMSAHESNCFFGEDASGFLKYYYGGKYAFVGVLPNDGDTSAYVDSLTAEKFAELFVFPESYSERTA
ncbi:MAG: serine protease inhibitor [Clostridia bacterium]|nr:serine protease inhibitor [Clostridia bacterium]